MSKKSVSEIEIPDDVLEEILARLPTKSLLRLACVSNAWCSLLRNPTFISKHLLNGADHALLNIRFLQTNRFSLLESPDLRNLGHLNIKDPYIVCQCDGLICFVSDSSKRGFSKPNLYLPICNPDLHLWNSAIKQHKILPKSNLLSDIFGFGFGYDPKSGDYKVVRFGLGMEAEVYSLRTDSWRPVASCPVAFKGMPDSTSVAVCLGGFCYWTGYTFSGRVPMIISYDLSNEIFRQYHVPELMHFYPYHVHMTSKIFVRKGSLALVMFPSVYGTARLIDIWSLDAGVDGPLTLKEHLDLVEVGVHKKHIGEYLDDVKFLLNDDLILTHNTRELITLKACHISTRQIRNISVKTGASDYISQIVGLTPSLVSLLK